jgi:hypothetical protein
LAAVRIKASCIVQVTNAVLTVEIRDVAPDGSPGSAQLLNFAVGDDALAVGGNWTTLLLPTPLELAAGQRFTLVLRSKDGCSMYSGGGNLYPAGELYSSVDLTAPLLPTNDDLTFQTVMK